MKLINKVSVQFNCTLKLTEGEMRALDALTGYGFEPFLSVFYKHMGKHYMKPYEKDLKEIFIKVRDVGVPQLTAIDRARKLLDE